MRLILKRSLQVLNPIIEAAFSFNIQIRLFFERKRYEVYSVYRIYVHRLVCILFLFRLFIELRNVCDWMRNEILFINSIFRWSLRNVQLSRMDAFTSSANAHATNTSAHQMSKISSVILQNAKQLFFFIWFRIRKNSCSLLIHIKFRILDTILFLHKFSFRTFRFSFNFLMELIWIFIFGRVHF